MTRQVTAGSVGFTAALLAGSALPLASFAGLPGGPVLALPAGLDTWTDTACGWRGSSVSDTTEVNLPAAGPPRVDWPGLESEMEKFGG